MKNLLKYSKTVFVFLILFILNISLLFAQEEGFSIEENPFKTNVFIENHGQFNNWVEPANSDILFAVNNGEKMFFTSNSLIFRLDIKENNDNAEHKEEKNSYKDYYVNLEWANSNKKVIVEKKGKEDGYYTFGELGYEAIKASGYKNLIYKGLYDGVDVEYTIPGADSSGIKYNITIYPNGDYQKIKMKYNGDIKSLNLNHQGNVIIETMAGQMMDHFPTAFYKESGKSVAVKFVKNKEGQISFDFPQGFDKSKTIIIDPWMVTPTSLTTDNYAYDVDFDDIRNVYVSGGTFPFKLAKYDDNGNFLWTLTMPNNFVYDYYTEFGLIRKSGSIYIGGIGLPDIIKVNSLGSIILNSPVVSPNNEIWTIFYNSCTDKMLGFGGGTSGLENLYLFNDTNLTTLNVINSNGASGLCCNDIADAIIDFNGDIYYLSVSDRNGTTPSVDNHIFKNLQSNSYLPPVVFDITTGYTFDECGCYSSTFRNIGAANVLALNTNYFFSYNGKKLDAWDKTSGVSLGSIVVNSSYTEGRSRLHQGIAVDECNNVYVAGNQAVHTFTFDGNTFTVTGDITTNIPDEVFDVVLDEGRGLLYVSGKGFVSSIPTPILCNTMTVSTDINCLTSSVAISPIGGVPPYTYQWSNGSTSNVTTLTPGTHTVTITDASCIKRTSTQTIEIPPSALANLEVNIPNVFSPNQDNQNELFKVDAFNIQTIRIKIFNRWGNLLYESDTNDGWDGRTKEGEETPQGTYFYLIEIKIEDCGKKQTKDYKGTLTLLR